MAGRHSKLTPTLQDGILRALRAGNTRTASAEYVGIARETMSRWLGRNAAFRHAVEQAEAHAEVFCVTKLHQAIQEGSTADARWWLERRRHEDWRKREEHQLTGKDGAPLPIVVMPSAPPAEDS